MSWSRSDGSGLVTWYRIKRKVCHSILSLSCGPVSFLQQNVIGSSNASTLGPLYRRLEINSPSKITWERFQLPMVCISVLTNVSFSGVVSTLSALQQILGHLLEGCL